MVGMRACYSVLGQFWVTATTPDFPSFGGVVEQCVIAVTYHTIPHYALMNINFATNKQRSLNKKTYPPPSYYCLPNITDKKTN